MSISSHSTHCPVCGTPIKDSETSLLSCQSCGLKVRLDARGIFTTEFDESSVGYPEDGAENTLEVEDRSFWFAHRHEIIQTTMERFKASGAILDVGGGNGFETLRLQQRFVNASLIEPGLSGCLAGKARGVKNVIQGTLESLEIKDAKISAACFFDVIEHLEHPESLLRETHRILSAEGLIYITVPAFSFLWSDEDVYANHYRRYSKKTLQEELARAGFKVEYISYYFGALTLPIFILRTIPSWLGIRKVEKMNKNEHAPKGLVQKIIDALLSRELSVIQKGRRMFFGSSIVCVAKKVMS